MTENQPTAAEAGTPKAELADVFRDGRGPYAMLVVLGVALHALNILVIAIIMPTVVADIGGAAYYTWPSMAYTIGSIIGAACVGPVWAALGARKGYTASAMAFLIGTTASAVAPDMASLIAARTAQGLAGGLVIGGGMALVSGLFDADLRTRVLAMYQGTWMVAQLLGPVMGGVFAEIGWWRGSFWAMVPIILCLAAVAWFKLPDRLEFEAANKPTGAFPLRRLVLLTGGVFCIAAAGPVDDMVLRAVLVAAATSLVWYTFHLDSLADNRLYPSHAMSVYSPVGLAFCILFLIGLVQTSVNLFLPLLLQVVHGVTPLLISFVSIVITMGWTIGTFAVSGWSGARERAALWVGPLLMIAGLGGMMLTAQTPALALLTLAAFVMGVGVGTHNVHLLARTMAAALKGEERITASAMPSIRSLGTAFGAALAGMLSTIAGLGDATEAQAVGNAVTFVYGFALLPLGLAAIFMFRLVRLGRGGSR
jgi:MFS family permease